MNRRAFLHIAAGGAVSVWLSQDALADDAGSAPPPAPRPGAKADACIAIFLDGGPSHIDTFDPKPGTREGGPFKAIRTRIAGARFSQHLPRLADRADRLTIVRGMTTKEGNHQRARYLVHTGYAPTASAVHPAFGAWTSAKRGDPRAPLPAFVSVSGPSAGGGALGPQHGPFVVLEPGAMPSNVLRPRRVDAAREDAREGALAYLDARFAVATKDPRVDGRRSVHAGAVALMHSSRLDAFDLAHDPASIQKAYGDTAFGRGCLLARRLVEAGVKYVEVQLDGWDTHKDGFTRTKALCATLDAGLSALVDDLDRRHLLGRTLVATLGEFGRTPNINADDGRDHHPAAWSALLAGGGLRAGVVHGATDARGDAVVEGKTTVPDLFATFATLLGIDPAATVESHTGRPLSITDHGKPVPELVA